MKCEACGSAKVKVEKRSSIQEIKGESIDVLSDAFVCSACGNHYYDNDQMNALAMMASNEYRKRNGLLTSQQIIAYRHRLGMTQQEFADYIKAGVASIKRWEGLGIQDEAMDELIRLKCDPIAQEAAEDDLADHIAQDDLTGNRRFSRERLVCLIATMVQHAKSPLFINKGVWYSDFRHFQKHGVSLTGSAYRHLDHGPVAIQIKRVYKQMESEGILKKISLHDYSLEEQKIDLKLHFDAEEIETINEVISFIKNVGYKKLPDISHKEDAWEKTSDKEFISYNYAKKLKAKIGK